MAHKWSLRCQFPSSVVLPVAPSTDPRDDRPSLSEVRRTTQWRRTSLGLYVPRSSDRNVFEQRIAEEACRLPPGGAVTGAAALRLHGGNLWDGTTNGENQLPVELAIPDPHNIRPRPGIVVIRGLLDHEWEPVHGIPCATVERALFDVVRKVPTLRRAMIEVSMAMSAGLTTGTAFHRWLATCPPRYGIVRAREALLFAGDRFLSRQEAELCWIWQYVEDHGTPLCNWPLVDGSGRYLGRPDLLCPIRHVVGEYDGADHADADRRSNDEHRSRQWRRVGLEPFRVTKADLREEKQVIRLMEDAIAAAARNSVRKDWYPAKDPAPVCQWPP